MSTSIEIDQRQWNQLQRRVERMHAGIKVMMSGIVLSAMAGIFLWAPQAMSEPDAPGGGSDVLPHHFIAGQPAVAQHLNENLTHLQDRIGQNSVAIDDKLPNTGGTITGDLTVEGTMTAGAFSGIALEWGEVQTTDWLNNWDHVVDHELPPGHVMVGLYSQHWNGAEDRRFKIYYSRLSLTGVAPVPSQE